MFLFVCFFFVLKTCFLCFVFLSYGHGFWPILTIVILVFVNFNCFLVYLFFVFLSSSSLRKSVCCSVNWASKLKTIFQFLFFVLNQKNQVLLVLFWVKKFFLEDFFVPLILVPVLLHLKPVHFVFNFLFLYFWIKTLFLIVSLCPLHFVHCSQWSFYCLFILLNLLIHLFVGFAPVLRCFR